MASSSKVWRSKCFLEQKSFLGQKIFLGQKTIACKPFVRFLANKQTWEIMGLETQSTKQMTTWSENMSQNSEHPKHTQRTSREHSLHWGEKTVNPMKFSSWNELRRMKREGRRAASTALLTLWNWEGVETVWWFVKCHRRQPKQSQSSRQRKFPHRTYCYWWYKAHFV